MNDTPGNRSPVIRTASGLLRGLQEAGIFKFLGVPYGAPPVGERRWRPPQPVEPWPGIRPADSFGPAAPQINLSGRSELDGGLAESEDCLYLNVWTPSLSRREKLPVMVWIHGGGYMNGSGALGKYDGAALAEKGTVLVTFNYRLGPLGSLVHEDLEAASANGRSGNYGFLDQVAALEWVRDNITEFGGDPARVTVFGQSAGAMSAGLLSSSPRAKGLFHRGICQSGGLLMFPREVPYEEALADGLELQRALGASGIGEMRRLPAAEIAEAARRLARGDEQPKKLRFAPVRDDVVIKAMEETLGERAGLPLMVGSNADEAAFFTKFMPPVTLDNYPALVKRSFGEKALLILASYPVGSDEEANRTFLHLRTRSLFTAPVYELAGALGRRGGRVYVYRFNRVAPGNLESGLGASHGEEIPYVFGHADGQGYDATDRRLSGAMMGGWTQFARTGNPNGEGLPEWPAFSPRAERYLELNDEISVRDYGEEEP
ncbi:MAG TPA: carboxylesterase family protein [Dehalococcoidales bacterium]|nr:carboxylesterase family protein [Dehalococcoidales bacterium]